ncbi:MAG: SpoIIE family protein phosphatase [Comamonadaceae bacterium]|nr:SpoIIE family protein phosphatase [Comamonadaceae bacterium]
MNEGQTERLPCAPTDQFERDVAAIALFRNTETALILEALKGCLVLQLAADTPLLRPGEINHSVFIPLPGTIVVYLDTHSTAQTTIPIAVGECVGELSAIDGKPVSGLVVALTEARVLKVPQDIFWNRLMTLPGVASSFMVLLSERLRRSTAQALKSQSEQMELMQLRKDLNVARQLQASMLPLQRPLFPGRDDIEVCGIMEPASSVGGDLFDAFFVRDRLLFFCIGDVSGHGIASALFMARAIGLLRILAMTTFQPDKLLTKLNQRLCLNNDTNLFLTIFCAFLDVDTGRMTYSNGGHCPPILCAAGELRDLAIPKGPLVGALPGARYTAKMQILNWEDVLYCYTDGVTEAQNTTGEEFSEDRCKIWIGQAQSQPLQHVLDGMRRHVATFTGTEVLEDDFTMLALRRKL